MESEQSHTLKGNYLMALFTDDFSDMAVEAAKSKNLDILLV